MSKDPFKTRLEIAKKKVSKRDLENKKDNQSPIGTAFKLSTELVSAVAVGTIIGFLLDKILVQKKPNNCPVSYTHLTLPTILRV